MAVFLAFIFLLASTALANADPITAAAIGTYLIQTAISVAISYGVGLLAQKLQKKRKGPEGGAVVKVQFGEQRPELVACGLVLTGGALVYDNTYGTANINWQRVYELSSFRSTSLERVAINGEWVTLGTLDATKGYPVTSGEYANLIWVKFINGTQTAVDSYLGSNDSPAGRWGANHIGYGLTYAIVTLQYSKEKLTSPPDLMFEFKGAPLYDWRLDSTAGGSGSHRFNNVATWAWSANPILMDYCYRRGGFAYGTDVFCGMQIASAELPIAAYTAAANICDETVEGEARYRCSIFLDATREHRENLEDIHQSCAAMNVDGIATHYPIINASQTPVATLSAADLVDGQDYAFDRDGSFGDVVNSVNGTYAEPNFVYEFTGYGEQINAAAVTLDRRTLDAELSFPMVTSKRQAEQLASIYLSESRFAATKTCTVAAKWQSLDVGDWITWTNDDDGAASRDYQIVEMVVLDLDGDTPRGVQLTLRERDDSIYAGIGPVSPPTRPAVPALPTYLNEVAGFAVIALQVEDDAGGETPAFRASWTAITDPTVDSVLVEWRVRDMGTPPVFRQIVPVDQTIAILQEGVVHSTIYEVRTQLLTSPYRATTPSAWTTVTSGAFLTSVETMLGNLGDDVREMIENALNVSRRTAQQLQEITLTSIKNSVENNIQRTSLKVQTGLAMARFEDIVNLAAGDTEAVAERVTLLEAQVGEVEAGIVEVQTAYVAGDDALAADLLTVQARNNAGTASGFFQVSAEAAAAGYDVRLALGGSIAADGATKIAGLFIDVSSTGPSRVAIKGDQVVIQNTSGAATALFDATGAYIQNAFITNLTASNITVGGITTAAMADGAITAAKIISGAVTGVKIADGVITASKIIDGELTGNSSASAPETSFQTTASGGSTWEDAQTSGGAALEVTITVATNASVLVMFTAQISGASAATNQTDIRVLLDGAVIVTDLYFGSADASDDHLSTATFIAIASPAAGSRTLKAQFRGRGSAGNSGMRGRNLVVYQFRK